MTTTLTPADIPDGHIHQSEVLRRGWTRELIKAELGDRRVRTETRIDACTSPVWYPVAAVEAAEAGDAFRAHRAAVEAVEQVRREQARARRTAAAPAAAERNALIAALDPELVEQRGRRLYIRCGYESRLGDALRGIGATWDREEKGLWVGTGKAELLPPLLSAEKAERAAQAARDAEKRAQRRERMQKVAEVQSLGLWIKIPYREDCEIRARAKALGAIWNPGRSEFDPKAKQWAMPDRASYNEIAALLRAQSEQISARREARRQAEEAERAATPPTDWVWSSRRVNDDDWGWFTHHEATAGAYTVCPAGSGPPGDWVDWGVRYQGNRISGVFDTAEEAMRAAKAHFAGATVPPRREADSRSPFRLVDLRGEPSRIPDARFYDEDAGVYRRWDSEE
jgi:hypothetical protein